MAAASSRALDFTNVKEQSFNKKHQKPGDYAGKVKAVQDAKSKADDEAMWLFTIEAGSGSYPYYCKLDPDSLWKVRNLFAAAGFTVPKKRVKIDPNKVVGKAVGVTLDDEEYKGKMQSVVAGIIPMSEIQGDADEDEDEETEETEDEEESTEEADADEDEDEAEEPAPAPAAKPKPAGAAKKPKPAPKPAPADDDDELEEIEIEEI